jgi:hypothetical protein
LSILGRIQSRNNIIRDAQDQNLRTGDMPPELAVAGMHVLKAAVRGQAAAGP